MKTVSASKTRKICFVCPFCYPLFNPENKSIFGGGEVYTYQIAKEIAKRGNFQVSVIVADHGQPHQEVVDGVRLIPWKDWDYWQIPEVAEIRKATNQENHPPTYAPFPPPVES